MSTKDVKELAIEQAKKFGGKLPTHQVLRLFLLPYMKKKNALTN